MRKTCSPTDRAKKLSKIIDKKSAEYIVRYEKMNCMRKIAVSIFVVLLGVFMFSGCSLNNSQVSSMTTEENQHKEERHGSNDTSKNSTRKTKDQLTSTQAWELLEQWLEDHSDMTTPYENTTIAGLHDDMYVYKGEGYYLFNLNGYYWMEILVHHKTGELLCIVSEESDEPVEPVIEPLSDFYNRFYFDDGVE